VSSHSPTSSRIRRIFDGLQQSHLFGQKTSLLAENSFQRDVDIQLSKTPKFSAKKAGKKAVSGAYSLQLNEM
jgi:hypothetical protein